MSRTMSILLGMGLASLALVGCSKNNITGPEALADNQNQAALERPAVLEEFEWSADRAAVRIQGRPMAAPTGGKVILEGRPAAASTGGRTILENRPMPVPTSGGWLVIEGRPVAAPAGGKVVFEGRPAAAPTGDKVILEGRAMKVPDRIVAEDSNY